MTNNIVTLTGKSFDAVEEQDDFKRIINDYERRIDIIGLDSDTNHRVAMAGIDAIKQTSYLVHEKNIEIFKRRMGEQTKLYQEQLAEERAKSANVTTAINYSVGRTEKEYRQLESLLEQKETELKEANSLKEQAFEALHDIEGKIKFMQKNQFRLLVFSGVMLSVVYFLIAGMK